MMQFDHITNLHDLIRLAGEFTACYSLNSPVFQASFEVILQNGIHGNGSKPIEFATYDYIPQELKGLVKHALVVKQPAYKMGREVAQLLIDSMTIQDSPIIQMTIKSEIVEEMIE